MFLKKIILITLFVFTNIFIVQSQDKEERLLTQYSSFLSKTYYNFNLGGIFYGFSNENLNTGYVSNDKNNNAFSGRFLLGYKLNEDLGIQFGVMRPASWFEFVDINGELNKKSVWINLWSLSLKNNFNITDRIAIYGEAGIGNLTRVGFSMDDNVVYSDAHYATFVAGMGLKYTLNEKWDFLLNGLYLPKSDRHNEPSIFQSTLGLQYNVRQIPKSKAENMINENSYFFPKRFIQIGYGTSEIGFLSNRFFSMNARIGNYKSFGLPIFWHGDSMAKHTFALTYQQTAFHTEKSFSLDWGMSVTGFQTVKTNTNVVAFSVFPVVRFYFWRNKPFDMYANYSIIGPTYLTKKNLDGFETGPKLTYQDFMGVGAFFGKNRDYNFELRIMHYSNGNIFTTNDGVAIPIVFTLGKTL